LEGDEIFTVMSAQYEQYSITLKKGTNECIGSKRAKQTSLTVTPQVIQPLHKWQCWIG